MIEDVDMTEDEFCENCGEKLRTFMHNCSGTSSMEEMFGCPSCDDHCGFCDE